MINNRYLIWERERKGGPGPEVYLQGEICVEEFSRKLRPIIFAAFTFSFPLFFGQETRNLEHLHRAIIRIVMIILHSWGYLCIRKIKLTSADFVKISLSEVSWPGSFRETWVQWKKLSCKKLGPEMEPCESLPEMLARKSPAENALTWK